MKIYVTSLTFGSLVGWLCTASFLGLVGLFIASIAMSLLARRLIPRRGLQFQALSLYCVGILLFSQKLSQLVKMTSTGTYSSALGELPELILGVLLVPLMGIMVVQLINLLKEDRAP
ncbi:MULTISPECIES: hypothetical protein [unclassified Pseudomonas]|uniref:hypothetical protein n=1 Tax=unclassified Pseudomonas TaxID=196821 RepID=UPI002B22FDF0|nr:MULTISPECIES: hypothetical protein [unclassified Pseudomonas]MEA9979953.1 hypothetical protein [Pseudomonas sp. RTS4]MEB0198211.1 hypothetical protein [Pseudomonas sp. 5S4]MEB0247800.1 hypothetical protein [Pseudomonas sp. 10S5]